MTRNRDPHAPPPPALAVRTAGILLHPTSLPGPHGSGDLGRAAFAFVDFLAHAGVTWWQMLPIGPVGPGNSPYSSSSAFAGGEHLVSIDRLRDEGLLTAAEARPRRFPAGRVAFPVVLAHRRRALRAAATRFHADADRAARAALAQFRRRAAAWLEPFALYQALRRKYPRPWNRWPKAWRVGCDAAPRTWPADVAAEVEYEHFVQFMFDRQWRAVRDYGLERGVRLLGDIPIFVDHDSADVWNNQRLFELTASGRPKLVSGCPPDFFSRTGQLWGHPLFAWSAHRRTRFAWWLARLARIFDLFDAARIDHFLGFYRHWTVPGRAKVALRGRYRPSPGDALFTAARRQLGSLALIAEDLGDVHPGARELRDRFGFPGLRVLQNGFGDGARYDQPHNYPANSVAYTGTHDTDTTAGWWAGARRERVRGADGLTTAKRLTRYLDCSAADAVPAMIRALYASPANTAIVPLQDVLGLGRQARMNTPAVAAGNWAWRVRPAALTARLARRLRELAVAYERESAQTGGSQR